LVCDRLDAVARKHLDTLLTRVDDDAKSPWHWLKREPKQPTAQNNRDFLDHLEWLREQAIASDVFQGIPDVKVKQFAAEARSLDVGSMNDLTEAKRLTLALVSVSLLRIWIAGSPLVERRASCRKFSSLYQMLRYALMSVMLGNVTLR
jgi:hypothetical protein